MISRINELQEHMDDTQAHALVSDYEAFFAYAMVPMHPIEEAARIVFSLSISLAAHLRMGVSPRIDKALGIDHLKIDNRKSNHQKEGFIRESI